MNELEQAKDRLIELRRQIQDEYRKVQRNDQVIDFLAVQVAQIQESIARHIDEHGPGNQSHYVGGGRRVTAKGSAKSV